MTQFFPHPKHNRFSPGIIAITCKHKVCYGFQILSERESTEVVYELLINVFKRPPRMIIYDNACNLHTTCIMRLLFSIYINLYYPIFDGYRNLGIQDFFGIQLFSWIDFTFLTINALNRIP